MKPNKWICKLILLCLSIVLFSSCHNEDKLIRQMCKELGVTYVDYDPFFRAIGEKYYEPDGIHPKYSFYTEQYLPFVYKEVRR